MDYESIKADVLKELESLGLPQSEIDRIILDFDDIVTKVSDDPSLMKRLATDLINAAKFRANLKSEVPDTIPDEVIKSTPVTSRIVPKDTPGSILAMRGGDLPNPFYYQGGGPDAIVKISEGSTDANIAKVVELHKNWLETGNVPDGLSNDQIKKLADMREKQLNVIDNLPDDYKLGYYKPDATTSHAITLDNFIQQRKKNIQGGSLEFPLKKIISGMQKNVDQYGIEAAKVLGLDYGGTVNQGFKVVPEGSNSPNFQEFVDSGKWEEIESQDYRDRTKLNAENADGTVWFGETGTNSRGHGATKRYSGDKPWIENPTDVELRQWIIDNNIQTLNVAGNRSYGTEELGQKAMNTIIKAVDPNKLPPQGGSLGAAKLNDPNVFETFIENATTDEKKMIKGLDESGKLDDVGGVKGLITDLVTQYPQTAKVIGRSLGAFLQGAATLIDPIGEAIDLGLKLGGKKPVVGGVNALKREGFTWALWQASAFGYTQLQDMGNIVNMTLDKVGLLPDWYKDKVDVPQNMEEINAEYAINTEKNRRLGNQGYKATSLWWWLDQGIPARLTGLSPIEWAIRKYEYNKFGDITDDEKKFLDIMYGYDTRMEKNKESMFGWWQNEFDTNFTKKYYNEAHINDFRKIEKIGPEFGSEGVELYNDFKELGLIDE
jgi:hypothetical protein